MSSGARPSEHSELGAQLRLVVSTLGVFSAACGLIAGLDEKSRPPSTASGAGAGGAAGAAPAKGGSDPGGGTGGHEAGTGGDAPVDRAPSCRVGAPGAAYDCGASGEEDCCESPLVDGGYFDRYGDNAYPFEVSSFRLDRFEVTVARFRSFRKATEGGYRPEPGEGKRAHLTGGAAEGEVGWLPDWDDRLAESIESCPNGTFTTGLGPNEHRPVTCATYYHAAAFCIWDGGFLPTSNELLYVTVGGNAMRVFPWQGALDASRAVYAQSNVANVGTKPDGASAWGQDDIIGNVWEIVADNVWVWDDRRCNVDCAFFDERIPRVFALGGSFESTATTITDMASRDLLDRSGNDETGFRCARAP